MSVSSSIVEEKHGKGHTDHGNGKGKGHLKHQDDAMADGNYIINIDNVYSDDTSGITQTSAATNLVDGSKLTTEVRNGTIDSIDGSLLFDTDSTSGRLRLNVAFDTDNQ